MASYNLTNATAAPEPPLSELLEDYTLTTLLAGAFFMGLACALLSCLFVWCSHWGYRRCQLAKRNRRRPGESLDEAFEFMEGIDDEDPTQEEAEAI